PRLELETLSSDELDIEPEARQRVVAAAEPRPGPHDGDVLVAPAEKSARDRGSEVDHQREPPSAAEIEAAPHATPRTRIAAGRCEAAAVQLQRAAVERGAPANDPELRPASSVRMVRCEIERDVGVLDEDGAGEPALQIEEGLGVGEAEHGASEADRERVRRVRRDAQAADPTRLLATGALAREEHEAI